MRTSNYYTTRKKPEEEKRGLIREQISNSQLLERALSARQHLHTEAGQFVHESIIFSAQNNQTYQITRKRNAPLLLIENSQGGLNNICSAAGIRQCQPKAASRTTASRAREESVPFRIHNSVLRMNSTEKTYPVTMLKISYTRKRLPSWTMCIDAGKISHSAEHPQHATECLNTNSWRRENSFGYWFE